MKLREFHYFLIGILIGSSVILVPYYFYHQRQVSVRQDLFKAIRFHEEDDRLIYNDTLAKLMYDKVKVLCMVMTYPENHKTKAIHVKNLWGKRCNKIVFMSSEIDLQLDTVALPIENTRAALWNKTKASFRYLYDHFIDDFDWFVKADDDK